MQYGATPTDGAVQVLCSYSFVQRHEMKTLLLVLGLWTFLSQSTCKFNGHMQTLYVWNLALLTAES